ncbi:hypothetical protein ACGC1H_003278 [Rhizoctonia solani]
MAGVTRRTQIDFTPICTPVAKATFQRARETNRLLEEMRQNFARSIDGLSQRLNLHERRLDRVDEHFGEVHQRLAGVDERLAGIDQHVAEIDGRLDGAVRRLHEMEQQPDGVGLALEGVDERLDNVQARIAIDNCIPRGLSILVSYKIQCQRLSVRNLYT